MAIHHRDLAFIVGYLLFTGLALPEVIRKLIQTASMLTIMVEVMGPLFLFLITDLLLKTRALQKIPGTSERGGGPGGLAAAEPRWSGFCATWAQWRTTGLGRSIVEMTKFCPVYPGAEVCARGRRAYL